MTRLPTGNGAELAARNYMDFVAVDAVGFIGALNNANEEIELTVETAAPSPAPAPPPSWCIAAALRTVANAVYTSSIFTLLSYSTGYFVYKMVADAANAYSYSSSLVFSLITPISYIIALFYFRTESFDELFASKSGRRVEAGLLSAIIGTSVVANAATLVFYLLSSSVAETEPIEFLPLLVLNWIYSRTLLATMVAIFFYVFIQHYLEIRELVVELRDDDIWLKSTIDKNAIGNLSHRVIDIKSRLDESIRIFQPLYLAATILGSVGVGLMLDTRIITTYNIMFCVIYSVLQLFFLLIIYNVSAKKEKVINIVNSPSFSMKYILRNYRQNEKITGESVADQLSQSGLLTGANTPSAATPTPSVQYNPQARPDASSEWLILNSVLSERWANFTFLGISFGDGSGIKKVIAMTLAIITFFSNLDKYKDFMPSFSTRHEN